MAELTTEQTLCSRCTNFDIQAFSPDRDGYRFQSLPIWPMILEWRYATRRCSFCTLLLDHLEAEGWLKKTAIARKSGLFYTLSYIIRSLTNIQPYIHIYVDRDDGCALEASGLGIAHLRALVSYRFPETAFTQRRLSDQDLLAQTSWFNISAELGEPHFAPAQNPERVLSNVR